MKNQSFMNNKNDGRKVYDITCIKYALLEMRMICLRKNFLIESNLIMNPQALITEKLFRNDQKTSEKLCLAIFAETYADEYAASLSAQTNQDTLKGFIMHHGTN